MSLVAFQKLLAALVADPAFCKRLKNEPELMAGYELTARERERITDIIHQRGMVINGLLYNLNRYVPLKEFMPRTCKLLGEQIYVQARLFWDGFIKTNFQFEEEVMKFGAFLLERIDRGGLDIPRLRDVVSEEMELNVARFGLSGNVSF